jgi:hypothetical protein
MKCAIDCNFAIIDELGPTLNLIEFYRRILGGFLARSGFHHCPEMTQFPSDDRFNYN